MKTLLLTHPITAVSFAQALQALEPDMPIVEKYRAGPVVKIA